MRKYWNFIKYFDFYARFDCTFHSPLEFWTMDSGWSLVVEKNNSTNPRTSFLHNGHVRDLEFVRLEFIYQTEFSWFILKKNQIQTLTLETIDTCKIHGKYDHRVSNNTVYSWHLFRWIVLNKLNKWIYPFFKYIKINEHEKNIEIDENVHKKLFVWKLNIHLLK